MREVMKRPKGDATARTIASLAEQKDTVSLPSSDTKYTGDSAMKRDFNGVPILWLAL
ncbi:hypothetical protein RSAG8_03262, partial [Rhizoctonia solani AG-8 WAC10335]